jgi:hypothetical protein
MEVDTKLPNSQSEDYIVLEEEYISKGRLFGLANSGGQLAIGNFILVIRPVDEVSSRIEFRYIPKGNFFTKETFAVKKKSKIKKSKELEEVEL